MTIRHRSLKPSSAIRQTGRFLQLFYPANNAAYILASTQSSAMTVGTALTLLEQTTRGLTSFALTPGGAPASAFTFDVVGENQFGETVRESITTGTSANIVHTVNCYRYITSITPTAKSSTGTDALSIGWTGVVTSGTPRLALPCKPASTASLRRFSICGATGAMPTFTPELTRYTVAISAQPLVGSTVMNAVICHTDEEDTEI